MRYTTAATLLLLLCETAFASPTAHHQGHAALLHKRQQEIQSNNNATQPQQQIPDNVIQQAIGGVQQALFPPSSSPVAATIVTEAIQPQTTEFGSVPIVQTLDVGTPTMTAAGLGSAPSVLPVPPFTPQSSALQPQVFTALDPVPINTAPVFVFVPTTPALPVSTAASSEASILNLIATSSTSSSSSQEQVFTLLQPVSSIAQPAPGSTDAFLSTQASDNLAPSTTVLLTGSTSSASFQPMPLLSFPTLAASSSSEASVVVLLASASSSSEQLVAGSSSSQSTSALPLVASSSQSASSSVEVPTSSSFGVQQTPAASASQDILISSDAAAPQPTVFQPVFTEQPSTTTSKRDLSSIGNLDDGGEPVTTPADIGLSRRSTQTTSSGTKVTPPASEHSNSATSHTQPISTIVSATQTEESKLPSELAQLSVSSDYSHSTSKSPQTTPVFLNLPQLTTESLSRTAYSKPSETQSTGAPKSLTSHTKLPVSLVPVSSHDTKEPTATPVAMPLPDTRSRFENHKKSDKSSSTQPGSTAPTPVPALFPAGTKLGSSSILPPASSPIAPLPKAETSKTPQKESPQPTLPNTTPLSKSFESEKRPSPTPTSEKAYPVVGSSTATEPKPLALPSSTTTPHSKVPAVSFLAPGPSTASTASTASPVPFLNPVSNHSASNAATTGSAGQAQSSDVPAITTPTAAVPQWLPVTLIEQAVVEPSASVYGQVARPSSKPAAPQTLPQAVIPANTISDTNNMYKGQVGFRSTLPWEFVATQAVTQAQLTHFVPGALNAAFSGANAKLDSLRQGFFNDTSFTVAYVWVSVDMVNTINEGLKDTSSAFYNSPDISFHSLAQQVDPNVPFMLGGVTPPVVSPTAPGTTSPTKPGKPKSGGGDLTSVGQTTKEDANSGGSGSGSGGSGASSSAKPTIIGLTALSAAAGYLGLMILLMRHLRLRRARQFQEALASPTSRTSSRFRDRNMRGVSISAPMDSENSLGI